MGASVQPNPDAALIAKITALRSHGATDDEVRAFVDEWDRTHGTSAAPVDRTDQTTVRNPNGEDPLVRFGPTVAGLLLGGAAGEAAGAALLGRGVSALGSAVGGGTAGSMVGGMATRGMKRAVGDPNARVLDPSAMAGDALFGVGGSLVGAGIPVAAKGIAKYAGLFRDRFAQQQAGQKLAEMAKRMGITADQMPQAALDRVGPDALVLNAGDASADAARQSVRTSRAAHQAILPALTRQQEGAKTTARLFLERLFGPARGTQPEMAQALVDAQREAGGAVKGAYDRAWAASPGPVTDPAARAAIAKGEQVVGDKAVEGIVQDLERLNPLGTFIRTPAGPPTDQQVLAWLQQQMPGVNPARITPQMIQQARPAAQAAGVVAEAEPSLQYAAELKSRVGKVAKHAPPNEVQPTSTHLAATRMDETDLRDALHQISPEYQAADALYATNEAQQQALERGHKAAGEATSAQGLYDYQHTVPAGARPGSARLAQGAFRQGQRARYAERIEAASPAEDVVGKTFGSDAQQALIRETTQGNAAQELGPTLARERARVGDANVVGAPSDPGIKDVRLDPGEWSIRQGYVGNVIFPAADVAAKLGKKNLARVDRAAEDIVGRLLARRAMDPQVASDLAAAVQRAVAAAGRQAARQRRLALLLGGGSTVGNNAQR